VVADVADRRMGRAPALELLAVVVRKGFVVGRPKKATATLQSLDECSDAMRRLLLATLAREKLVANRDEQCVRVTKSFETEIGAETETERDLAAQLQDYYITHLPEVETPERRSVKLTYGTMGRRLSPEALKPRNKSFTWKAIKVLLRALKNGERFFHVPKDPEPDKELIKKELSAEDLEKCGLKLEQEDEFFIELNRTASV